MTSRERWIRWQGVLLLFLLCLGLPVAADEGADDEDDGDFLEDKLPFEERVNGAIDRGVTWLKKAQKRDGSWGSCISSGVSYDGSTGDAACHSTGPTSFSIFTLARCGVPRKDPVIKKGLAWIRKQLANAPKREQAESGKRFDSYESASAILMFTAIYETGETPKTARSPKAKPRGSKFKTSDWRLMHECAQHLIGDGKSRSGCQKEAGCWGYYRHSKTGDVSATQFALLALRAARRAGYPVEKLDKGTWKRALEYLQRNQQADGTFGYTSRDAWSSGMTAAGLSCLLICREQLSLLGVETGGPLDDAIKRGFDALAKNYTPPRNVAGDAAAGRHYHYCYLYAVERVGSLARRTLLGKSDWYHLGAEALLSRQERSGAFNDRTSMGPTAILGTCFALLFLKRTTRPAVVTGAK